MSTQTPTRNVITLTDDSFSEVVFPSDHPVLVDFHGEWKPPWRGVSHNTRAELAVKYGGRVTLTEVNTAESRKTAEAYGVEQIPNVFIFVGGKVVHQFVGTVRKETLMAALDDAEPRTRRALPGRVSGLKPLA